MTTFDGNGYRARNAGSARTAYENTPSAPMVAREFEGEYSTIRYPDGTVETILFRDDGTTVGPVRTYQGIVEIQREHIRKIQAEIQEA